MSNPEDQNYNKENSTEANGAYAPAELEELGVMLSEVEEVDEDAFLDELEGQDLEEDDEELEAILMAAELDEEPEDAEEYEYMDADELVTMLTEMQQMLQEQTKSIRALSREVKELRDSMGRNAAGVGGRPPRDFNRDRGSNDRGGFRDRADRDGGRSGGYRPEGRSFDRDGGSRFEGRPRFDRDGGGADRSGRYDRGAGERPERGGDRGGFGGSDRGGFRERSDRGSFAPREQVRRGGPEFAGREFRGERSERPDRSAPVDDRPFRPRVRADRGWGGRRNDEE